MKGYKTILFGLLMIVGPAALTYLAGVDWTSLGISPGVASLIGAVVIGLRAMTSTPIGKAAMPLIVGLPLLLAACSSAQLKQAQDVAGKVDSVLTTACTDALAVAGLVPAIGLYITAGCATAEGIAKLAADPTSAQWLGELIGKIKSTVHLAAARPLLATWPPRPLR